MSNRVFTIKDFENSIPITMRQRAEEFVLFTDQLASYGSKSYWIESQSGVGSHMSIRELGCDTTGFISNDYLGMSHNPQTIQAGCDAVVKYGTGACAAQPIGGYLDIHHLLEQKIAEFTGQEDAIIFSSGFGANAGTLRAIMGPHDIAYYDTFIHRSALTGLIGTNTKNIGHNKPEYLDYILSREKDNYKTRLVILDGVYSQDGDLALLPEFIEVCHKHDCLLLVDDAHGIGVMGKTGRGTAEHFDCLGKVDFITGTFSKSFGCVGGFVAANKKMIQYLKYYADTNVFSAAISPQTTASVLKAIELITTDLSYLYSLWRNVHYTKRHLIEAGFDIGHSESPIIPIMVRDNEKVYITAKELQKRRIFASGIVYPGVRPKESRIRISILASHTQKQLDHLINSLIDIDKSIHIRQ